MTTEQTQQIVEAVREAVREEMDKKMLALVAKIDGALK